jgi:hypothetical protein
MGEYGKMDEKKRKASLLELECVLFFRDIV